METMTADNWWDQNHRDDDILKHFSDKALQTELDQRKSQRNKLELMKVIGKREAVGYFTASDDDELYSEWVLHILFSNGTKRSFVFSSRVGQTETMMEDFRKAHFPNLVRLDWDDFKRMMAAKKKLRNKKKKVCHGQP